MSGKRKEPEPEPESKNPFDIIEDKYIFLNTMKIILGDQNSRKNILKLLVLGHEYKMKTDIYKINGYTLRFLNIIDYMDYEGEYQTKYDKQIDFIISAIGKVKEKREILIFYGKNLPDPTTPKCPETHYQSFIYMNKKLLCIDPSLGCNGRRIYADYFTTDLKEKLEKSGLGILFQNNPVTVACQSHNEEVFCQSWSLYLQYHFLLQIVSSANAAAPSGIEDLSQLKAVDIPDDQSEKNKILYDFYKEIINKKPIITIYDKTNKSVIDLYKDNFYVLLSDEKLYKELAQYINVTEISELFEKFKTDDPLLGSPSRSRTRRRVPGAADAQFKSKSKKSKKSKSNSKSKKSKTKKSNSKTKTKKSNSKTN